MNFSVASQISLLTNTLKKNNFMLDRQISARKKTKEFQQAALVICNYIEDIGNKVFEVNSDFIEKVKDSKFDGYETLYKCNFEGKFKFDYVKNNSVGEELEYKFFMFTKEAKKFITLFNKITL